MDLPATEVYTWGARGLSGERATTQAKGTWTWSQLHLHVCGVLLQQPWDSPASLALFAQTRAVGICPLPHGRELLSELALTHTPPYNLRLEIYPQRLGKGRAESGPADVDAAGGGWGSSIPSHVTPLRALPCTQDYRVFSININAHTNLPNLNEVCAEVLCLQETNTPPTRWPGWLPNSSVRTSSFSPERPRRCTPPAACGRLTQKPGSMVGCSRWWVPHSEAEV